MSNIVRVDWVMETNLQRAYEDIADLITGELVTFEEAYNVLKWGYAPQVAEDFAEWWNNE